MLAAIRFRCPGCRARIKAPAALLGQRRTCPGCGHGMVVKPALPEDSGPRLVTADFGRATDDSTGARPILRLRRDGAPAKKGFRLIAPGAPRPR